MSEQPTWGSLLYILEGKIPVPCPDTLAWGQWMESHYRDRVVGQEDVGDLWVSTVFLGVDHCYTPGGEPRLFETMIFKNPGREWTDYQERTSTWELALEQHACAVVWAKEQMH